MSAGLSVVIALVLLVLIVLSALFSALETALFSLPAPQVARLKETNPRLGSALQRLLEKPHSLLGAILFGDAIVNFPLIILCVFLLRTRWHEYAPFWIEALLIFALIVIACDLVPKMFGLRQPTLVAKIGVPVLTAAMPLLAPILGLLEKLSEAIANALTPAQFAPRHFVSDDEMEALVELSAEEGILHHTESEMIQEIIKLGDKTVKDCMTPRVDAFLLPDDLTNDEAIRQLREKRYRRVPVYGETPDDVIGILDAKRFLASPREPYIELLDPPSFVPETMKAIDLLKNFLAHPQGLAVIVDEFGGTEGMITLSDLIEEIIGEAAQSRELLIEQIAPGRWIVNGQMRLDDLARELGAPLQEDGVDTIGGLVFNRLGHLPKPGTALSLDEWELTVRRTSRKRIEEVLIEKKADGEPTNAAPAA